MYRLIYPLFFILFLFSCKKEECYAPLSIHECNCQIETATDTYIYPIRPGSDEWNAFQSSEQMVEAVQISFSILNSMSTYGLIETCLENPLFLELYLAGSPQSFYDHYFDTFNVCEVLVNRKDAMHKLIERYSLMCIECIDNNYSNFSGKGGNVKFAFDEIELLLAQEDFLKKISASNRIELGRIVMDRYNKKKNNNFSLYHKMMSAWVAGRIMNYDNYYEILDLIESREEISIFINSGLILLPTNSEITVDEIVSTIMISFNNYLN